MIRVTVHNNSFDQMQLSVFAFDESTNLKWDIDNDRDYEVEIFVNELAVRKEKNPNKINIAWFTEPPIINGEIYRDIVPQHNKFVAIFSYFKHLKNMVPNFQYLSHGGTFLRPTDIALYEKSKDVSFIYSDKEWNAGHRFRHRIARLVGKTPKIHQYGTGSNHPVEFKIDALRNYRFSIAMENSIEHDYFTEKILDCFLSGTIPIYWGTRNVETYFDKNGILFFNNETDLIPMLESLTEQDYASRIDAVCHNFEVAKSYVAPEKQIHSYISSKAWIV